MWRRQFLRDRFLVLIFAKLTEIGLVGWRKSERMQGEVAVEVWAEGLEKRLEKGLQQRGGKGNAGLGQGDLHGICVEAVHLDSQSFAEKLNMAAADEILERKLQDGAVVRVKLVNILTKGIHVAA